MWNYRWLAVAVLVLAPVLASPPDTVHASCVVESATTYAEGTNLRDDKCDTSAGKKSSLTHLVAGEHVDPVEANTYVRTTGAIVRSTQLVGSGGIPTTATDATGSVVSLPRGTKTFHGVITCTGTCVQTQKIYGTSQNSATVATAMLLCTLTLNDTTATNEQCTVTTEWLYYFPVTSATSGTTPLSSLIAQY